MKINLNDQISSFKGNIDLYLGQGGIIEIISSKGEAISFKNKDGILCEILDLGDDVSPDELVPANIQNKKNRNRRHIYRNSNIVQTLVFDIKVVDKNYCAINLKDGETLSINTSVKDEGQKLEIQDVKGVLAEVLEEGKLLPLIIQAETMKLTQAQRERVIKQSQKEQMEH